MKVYIVVEEFGHFEDYGKRIFGVYESEKDAELVASELNEHTPDYLEHKYSRERLEEAEDEMLANDFESHEEEKEFFKNNFKDIDYQDFIRYQNNSDYFGATVEEHEVE